jgi:hypothetical protein
MIGWEEWDCKSVTGAFPCLQELSIKNCLNLKESFPEKLPCLMKLEISNCEHFVGSISFSSSIHELHLTNCGKLQFDNHMTTLKTLEIGGYCMEEPLLEWIRHTLSYTSLESLEIIDFPTLNIPPSCCYNFLVSLEITSSCDYLRAFTLDFFPLLENLELIKCSNLEMISMEHAHHHSLTSLTIGECPKFVSFPKGGFSAPGLYSFNIFKLENLKSLPECMHTLFPSLHHLTIENCPQLESFSDGGLPSSLILFTLGTCSKLLIASLKGVLGMNTSLKHFSITHWDMESFPDHGLLPQNLDLHSLGIYDCANLKNLDNIDLCHLSSVRKLYLFGCPNLSCLPMDGLPKSISILYLYGCPLLKQRCKKNEGEDWRKISHIPFVMLDD